MKFVLRTIYLSLALAGVVLMTGCASGPKHTYPVTLEDAKAQETKEPQTAFDEYIEVANKQAATDKEVAASTLLTAVNFAMDTQKFGLLAGFKPGDKDIPKETQEKMTDQQYHGQDQAHETLKNIEKTYGMTKVAAGIRNQRLLEKLEVDLDTRNRNSSKMWERVSYRVVDSIVAMTGRNPGFSYWFALVLIAVVVKVITLPLSMMMYKAQREMQKVQPALKALGVKYKDEPQELQKIQMQFYKDHNINPFASCLPMLIQIPFMIWVYNTIRLYEYHFANGTFLWVGKLQHLSPSWIAGNLAQFDVALLILYTLSMFLTMMLTPATDPAQAAQQKQMSIMTTGMMFFFFIQSRWSSAFILYWLALNLLSAAQSYYFVYRPNKLNPVVPVAFDDSKSRSDKKTPPKSGGGGAGKLTPARQGASSGGGQQVRRPRKPRK